MITHMRVARPTGDLKAVTRFYQDGLGFEVIDSFTDHSGIDGVMLGHRDEAYHLEFTHEHEYPVERESKRDNLLVFYLPDRTEWEHAVQRMIDHGYSPTPSHNPYWDVNGKTFEDPDGYHVVLQNTAWSS